MIVYFLRKDMKLLEIVGKILPDSSKTTMRSVIKEGRISVGGRVVTEGNFEVDAEDEPTVRLWPKVRTIGKDVQVLYEDADYVVINKPSGLLSVEANYEEENTAHDALKKIYRPGRVFVVHRLDREASGVMMFARTEEGLIKIKDLLKKHEIKREYCAIIEGVLEKDKGTWQSFLMQDAEYKVHSAETGELAITHFEVIKRSNKYTALKVMLETGRKNQIRVHCGDAGHPIVGDKKYGAKSNPVGRLCLHAYKISFVHPFKEKLMTFETPLPEELFTIWDRK